MPRPSPIPERTLRTLAAAIAGTFALGLCGCSVGMPTSWSLMQSIAESGFSGSSDVSLQQAAGVPFASMGIRLGDGPQIFLVLAGQPGDTFLWTSAAHVAVTTRNGRVTSTAGLPVNVDTMTLEDPDPLLAVAHGLTDEAQSTRLADYRERHLYAVRIACTAHSRGRANIAILGAQLETTRIDEDCAAAHPDWTFTDSFWIDGSGLVWKSVQHIAPGSAPLEIELFRPPAKP